ncbi:AIPR family protein [Flavobacterium taihuense]|uniref:AIPR family protein n=1 Tax=Flavobacterium taihuense TaxID=2857508 RepID=A0ABS6XZ09_9FLAO|nr:AIPR family protein [Flavobacterium taihuense]MBW4361905.1 AIPR family protein [Flavobacterium taihuense]
MSEIHVNHIKTHIEKEFKDLIDLSDVNAKGENLENFFLTRSLAAYSIQHHTQVPLKIASESVVDGGNDNGIDAIYYDAQSKYLYLVQSKWIHNGKGEPENGEVKKFISGIKDLLNFKFDRFNNKVKKKEIIIQNAVCDPKTKYQIILTYTGINNLAEPSRRDFNDLLEELNDASELVYLSIFNQKRIHSSLVHTTENIQPIDQTIQLKYFGKVTEPYSGYYGQVNGVEIYGWWDKYRKRLFAKNIRGVLGDTDVNKEITKTLEENPEHFWFYNNGITLVADSVEKNMVGGASSDLGQFICENISIVNGAQTVSSIGKFGEGDTSKLDKVFVPVKIIQLKDAEENFGQKITKANNTQNRVKNRDFVTFDLEQTRIREELLIDGIDYRISRGEYEKNDQISFDLIESTTALSCSSNDISIVVQLKREIGLIWDDLENAPYKKLFNAKITGRYVYNCVRTQRLIEQAIKEKEKSLISGRDQSILIHGNRIISLLVYKTINTKKYVTEKFNFDDPTLLGIMESKVNDAFVILQKVISNEYDKAIIVTLFKNKTKCQDIISKITATNFM